MRMGLSGRHARCSNGRRSIIKTICDQRRGSPSPQDFSTAVLMRARSARLFRMFGPQPTFISDHTERDRGISAGDANASRKFDLCRWRTFRSLQSIRRRLDLSLCRQLQDRQDEYDSAFQRRDRLQSAKQSGQDFRKQLRPGTGRRSRLGHRHQTAALGKSRGRSASTYFHNDLSNVIGFNGLFDTLNLGAAETQGLEAELRAQPIPNLVFTASLHLSRRGKNFLSRHFAAARRAFAAPAAQ